MNIFVLDTRLDLCAKYHCDKHIVKMILESAQLLSQAVRMSGLDAGYKITHKNHPCSIWTRASIQNYNWLRELARNLNSEYRYRYGRTENHKSWNMIESLPTPGLPDIGLTPFAQCMPDEYKATNAVQAYRSYYSHEKADILKYTKRSAPEWITKRKVLCH